MSWVTIIWSMTGAASLTLGVIHFLVWCQRRTARADLVFTLASVGVAAFAGTEFSVMLAETPEQYADALRWLHVPAWVIIVALVGFVRLHLRAGRRWLAWSVIALRSLTLLLNFLVGQNLNYLEVTRLRHIQFLGETVSLGVGVSNPWMLVGQFSLLLWVIFTIDATITVWRRGDRRQAVVTGGSILVFSLAGFVQAILVLWQLVDMPLTVTFFYLGIVVAMGYEMSRETLRAAQLSDELFHLSRVTTLSELSNSLAHELNQPLAIILTNAQAAQRLLAQEPPDVAETRDILADIVSENERAGEIIRRLRALLKPGQPQRLALSVNEIIKDVLLIARSDLIGRGVVVYTALAERAPLVLGDRIQLQQLLLNLIANAGVAMAANPLAQRLLTIASTRDHGLVRISISDTGCGLPSEPERIFQPFYTTKKDGLGLGLSICRSIATAHQGRLWAEASEATDHSLAPRYAGRGTTLHLEFPAVELAGEPGSGT